ncbi:MAG: hypothetical protein G01um101413_808 [Parcubacteria group bacterium Gr01-1014_13]|nr:MAG: hypothetical protein G01um101413_808 [Parcubacteria group bacterium Gr01-1014_13]
MKIQAASQAMTDNSLYQLSFNMKKSSIVAVVSLVVLVLVGLGIWYYQNSKSDTSTTPTITPTTTTTPTSTPVPVVTTTLSQGLFVNTPKANAVVSSPLVVSGHVDGKNRWTGFEGQVGTVQLLDGNGKMVTMGILTATTDWMKFPTNFSTSLNFANPKTSVGTLVFKNENASGLPNYEREFRLPVKFSTSSQTVVRAYFVNNNLDPKMTCEKVFPVTRFLPKTQAVAKAALEELLKGTTDEEMLAGYSTSLNAGVKINSLVIDKGVAKVDFNEALQNGVAGSCRVSVIRLQIINTLKQFKNVSSVVISINGKTEDILQP